MEETKNTTKDYVVKYKLDKDDQFNHGSFIRDFKSDFNILLTDSIRRTGNITPKKFDEVIKNMKDKFDAINNKTSGNLPDKLWNYFYATTIVTKRESFFPDDIN